MKENRQTFKNRMQSLRAYREQNPGKGYWEWRAQAFNEGGKTNSENNNQGITNSPYEDPTFVGKAYKGLQSILGKETKDYIGGLSRLKSLSNFMRVSGPVIDFVNYIFPNKKDQYIYNTNKHFRDIIQKDKIQDVTMLENGGEVEPPYPQFVNGQRVNRWTGQPIATGQATPVFDLRDAADFTPAGDVLAVKDTYEAVQNNDWVGAGLAAVGVLPFVPSVTKKLRREIPTVNKNYVSNAIDALDRQRYNRSSAEAAMNNETYEIVQRLMDDPSYMRRANEVKYRYGDDYLSTYADLINAYNYSPELLPKAKVTKFEDARRAQMIATPESANRHRQGGEFPTLGEYEYQFDPDNAVEGMTLHELDHQVDFLKNKVPDADGNSNMFYRMRQSLKPYSDGISKYYSNPTEQKAYMNQLREFMYKRGMIKTRDEQVTKEMLQEAMNKLPKSMSPIINASKQFKSMRAYTKWFNQIPLLTAGALGINRYYNQQQEQ